MTANSKAGSRAACPSDEDKHAGHCCREAHDRVIAVHGLEHRDGEWRGNEHRSSETATSRPDVTMDALVERDLGGCAPRRSPACAPSSGSPPPWQASRCAPNLLGVTSLVRALKLDARFYNKLVDHFHSPAVQLDRLAALWTQTVLRLFPQLLRINGRCVVVGDGIKVLKRGRKMPGVKLLHQQSESNTKPEYIMGHSSRAVSLLVQAAASVFAVPLAIRIHYGRGVVQSRPPHLARQNARSFPGVVSTRTALLLRRRRLLCRAQDRRRLARTEQPPGHPGEVQRRRLHRPPAARPAQARPAQGLWPQGQAQVSAG